MKMNHRAKFDAPSFILVGEIRNRTNTQTNSKRYTHTLPIGMRGQQSHKSHRGIIS